MGRHPNLVLVALGSNDFSTWGDVTETIQKAMIEVAKISQTDVKYSKLYHSPAFPAGAGPDFVNAAMLLKTFASPETILDNLHDIEKAAGRTRNARWAQRTLDLDLIAVGDQIHPNPDTHKKWRDLDFTAQQTQTPANLILPHPRLQDRSFVLVPLADIAPDWRHPALGQTVKEMLAARPEIERSSIKQQHLS